MYYGPFILIDAGYGTKGPKQLLINFMPIGTINFLGTFIAVYYSDRMGRRSMFLKTAPIMACSMLLLSFSMYLIYFTENNITGSILAIVAIVFYLIGFSSGFGP